MRRNFLSRGMRHSITGILLVAFVLRALIAPGYMPSADRPFTLQICPDGFPAHLLAAVPASHAEHQSSTHEHGAQDAFPHDKGKGHQHGASSIGHCIFGAATGVGPLPQVVAVAESSAQPLLPTKNTLPSFETERRRIHQPRAPPLLS